MNTQHKTLANIQKQLDIKYDNKKLKLGKYNLLYLNINSLRNKLDELESIIDDIQNTNGKLIHFIALTETRINESDVPFYNLQNYNVFHCTRFDGYGGCALFVHDTLSCNLIEKKSLFNIELLNVNIVDIAASITVVYKQPAVSGDIFIQTLNSFTENRGKMIIIGDMNINVLGSSAIVNRYIDSIVSNGLSLINKIDDKFATRIAQRTQNQQTTTTKSIIDHAITNCTNFSFCLSMNDLPISDHRGLLLAFDDRKNVNFLNVTETVSYSKIDKRKYNVDLRNLMESQTPHSRGDVNTFIEQLESIKSNSIVTKTLTKKSNPCKKWVTENFLDLIAERKRYFILRKKSPTNEFLQQKYSQICDKIQLERHLLRTKYNSDIVNQNSHNPKKMWKNINEILYNKNSQNNSIKALNSNEGNISTNRKQIADTFNVYFRDVGKSLYDKLTQSNLGILPLIMSRTVAHSMVLWNTSSEEVISKIITLKTATL